MDVNQIKQKFGIFGNDPELERAIEIADQVAGTDLSVLVTGESGVGKEVIPQIIHQGSARKHGQYIAVNCGAIPEGTIDSELFGHEKGSFTNAYESRKGYFEEADGGTLFLDEVAELPLSTQVRLLRVLQTGEYLRVGSSKVMKTDVRVIAATNINLMNAISMGKFREDLYYRLNTVPVYLPPLRARKGDIHLLFKKFALDFADRYMTPVIRLTPDAVELLESYRWPGNIRQLKSVTEQISVLERNRTVTADVLASYLPAEPSQSLPVKTSQSGASYMSDRDIIFKMIYDLRRDIEDLKAVVGSGGMEPVIEHPKLLISPQETRPAPEDIHPNHFAEDAEEVVSIQDASAELIRKALEKNGGKRKAAAKELGISERTLYRKIKELGL